jgi:hypothetical protein
MRRSWKLIPIIALVIGLVIPTTAPASEDKEAFFPATLQTDGNDRIFSIGDDAGITFSQLGNWPNKLCTSTKDPNCNFEAVDSRPENTIGATPLLELCEPSANDDCIESVEISYDGTTFKKLIFERYMPDGFLGPKDGNTFPSDYSKNLPRGGHPSIWVDKDASSESDIKYLAYFSYVMNYSPKSGKFEINEVNLAIRPFKEVLGNRWDALWEGGGKSGVQYDFKPNTTFRVAVHMSNEPAGWFKARLKDLSIEITKLNSRNNRLVVTGTSVTVPNFAVVRRAEGLAGKELELAQYFGYMKGAVGAAPGNERIFEYIEYWRPLLQDIAPKTNTFWTLNSTRWTSSNKCLSDTTRVLGVVSTNSMGYDGTAPKFVDGFLNYRVAGLHFAADGKTLNLGTYDLVMRSDAARCLYKFSSAPVSATVTIAGADGEQNIATTVVTENNGWLKMRAAGFTFSEKQIKLKLTQDPNAEGTPYTVPVAAVKKKSAITCVKGKTTKKVSAVSPKCPAGYKKKA